MKRHAFDPISLTFGILFLLIALVFLGGNRSFAELGFGWLWSVAAVFVGLLATSLGVRRALRAGHRNQDPAAGAEVRDDPTDAG